MGNRIPEETIEQIRSSLDIVDIVSEYIQLKKQGRNYFGLCPFHGENTPSFSVSQDRQIYHCFGCGVGGNVFSFVMEIDGLTFYDTALKLAAKAHIDLPNQEQHASESEIPKELKEILSAHELLQKLYHHLLMNTKEGKDALDYLTVRGFAEEELKKFQIGFAPDSWDLQTTFLTRRGFSLPELETAGLIAKRGSDGQYFDRFRGRIMFPIWDGQGRTIAFGGRILQDGEPKYLNSPESKAFSKGNHLYPFHLARPMIRKKREVILFEGYIDVIAAWHAGVKNGVATLGTSLTDQQVQLLKRNADQVTICYDADDAGINAANRALQMIEATGLAVRVAQMPQGFDPDDYIKKFGGESFKSGVIGDSLTAMGFKMQYRRRGKNLQNEGDRIAYIEDILQEISKLNKAIERDHYLRQLAEEFSLSLDALKAEQWQIYKQHKKKDKDTVYRNNKVGATLNKKLLPAYHNAERKLLAHMLNDEDIAFKVQEELGCAFNIDEHNAIAVLLYAYYEEGHSPNISDFILRLHDSRLKSIVTDLGMNGLDDQMNEQVLDDYLRQIKKYARLQEIGQIETRKEEAEQQKDYVKAAQIAMEMIKLKRDLK